MALLRVTSKCNQRCIFCSYPREGVERKKGLRSWIGELRGSQDKLVQISGGEPLLRSLDDLIAVTKFCAGRRVRVEFQTNAVLLAHFHESALQNLIGAIGETSGYFNVNFPSEDPATDARITGAEGNFEKRELAVLRLLDAGAVVRITHVLNSLNYRRIPHFVVYLKKRLRGVAWVQFSFVKAAGRALSRPDIVPSYREVSRYLTRGLEKAAASGVKCEVDHIPVCFIKNFWFRHVDVHKMMAGKPGPHQIEKRKIEKCAGCGFSSICSGPRLDYLQVHENIR